MTTYKKINLMVPTYKRSDGKLRVFIDTAMETVSDPKNIIFTFCINKEDRDTLAYLEEKEKEVKAKGSDLHVIFEELERPHLGKYFNMMYEFHKKNFDNSCLVSMLGDDMEFKSDGWDLRVIQAANLFDGICIIYGDDLKSMYKKMCVNLFTSVEMVDAQGGTFMCEEFEIDMIDLVWQQVADRIGINVYLGDVKIFHNHASLPGQMDAVWRRMREGYGKAHNAWATHGKKIVNEKIELIKKNLPEIFNPEFDVIMTTYDRTSLLTQTITSYNASQRLPEKIHVFDDCSGEIGFVRKAIATMKGAELNEAEERLCGWKKTPAVLKDFFELRKSRGVLILDSDVEFSPLWFHRACVLARAFKKNSEVAFWTLFNNRPQGSPVDELGNGLVPSKCVGALGCYVSPESYEKYIKPHAFNENEKLINWDNRMSQAATNEGKEVYVCSPALIQHTGYLDGMHMDKTMTNPTIAYDFYCHDIFDGDVFDRKYAIDKNYQKTGKVLFFCPARHGDVVAGAMIANQIIDMGFKVTFVALPTTEVLAQHVCPRAAIEIMKDVPKSSDWGYSDTSRLKRQFPMHGYYINAQWGSPENHYNYIQSGLHPLDWLRKRVERILNRDMSSEYLEFAKTGKTPPVDIEWNTYKPRCIIAPDAKTSNAISDELFKQMRDYYTSEGYEVKVLVKELPNDCVWRDVRDTYIFGLSIMQCIEVIKQCQLFVGNDSGLAWCSLHSNCEKHIYHKPERLRAVNTKFADVDYRAKDFVVLADGVTTQQVTGIKKEVVEPE